MRSIAARLFREPGRDVRPVRLLFLEDFLFFSGVADGSMSGSGSIFFFSESAVNSLSVISLAND
jgi:hypothetical protein